jgi:hypothetical protein
MKKKVRPDILVDYFFDFVAYEIIRDGYPFLTTTAKTTATTITTTNRLRLRI